MITAHLSIHFSQLFALLINARMAEHVTLSTVPVFALLDSVAQPAKSALVTQIPVSTEGRATLESAHAHSERLATSAKS